MNGWMNRRRQQLRTPQLHYAMFSISCLNYMPCCISFLIKWVHCFGLIREARTNERERWCGAVVVIYYSCSLLFIYLCEMNEVSVLLEHELWLWVETMFRYDFSPLLNMAPTLINLRWYRFLISSRSIRKWNKLARDETFRLCSYLMMTSMALFAIMLADPYWTLSMQFYIGVPSTSNLLLTWSLLWPPLTT
jgi:hypothetical protein